MPDDFRPFPLYNIEGVEVDLELLIKEKLVSAEYIDPDDVEEDTWKTMSFTGVRPKDIIKFHKCREDVNQRYPLIADQQDVATEGLLVVNLDFQGVPDALSFRIIRCLAKGKYAAIVLHQPDLEKRELRIRHSSLWLPQEGFG